MLPHKIRRKLEQYVGKLDSFAEYGNAILPFVIAGVGAWLLLGKSGKTATPLLSSDEIKQFSTQYGFTVDPYTPQVLISADCSKCDQLTESLNTEGISYNILLVTDQDLGTALYNKAVSVSGSKELPFVILNSNLVNSDLEAIKSAIEKQDPH